MISNILTLSPKSDMINEKIEIIIDKLIPRSNIRLVNYKNYIYIRDYDIIYSTLGYKLNKSNIYNLLMEQLNMRDSLIVLIKNNNTQSKTTIVVNSINIFNRIMYKLNRKKYSIDFYGLNLVNIPIYSCN